MSFAIASFLKPFAAFVFFAMAYAIARGLVGLIPSGRIKDVLYDKTIQKRHPWRFFLGFAALFYGVIVLVWLAV